MRIKRGSSYILVFAQIFILLAGMIAFSELVSSKYYLGGQRSAALVPTSTAAAAANDYGFYSVHQFTKGGGYTHNGIDGTMKGNTASAYFKPLGEGTQGIPITTENIGEFTPKGNSVMPGAETPTGPEGAGFLSMLTDSTSSWYGGLIQGAAWGGIVYGAISLLGPMFTENEALVDSLSMSLGAGVFAGRSVTNLVSSRHMLFMNEATGKFLGMQASTAGFVVGGAIAVAIFLATYKQESTEVIRFNCQPWEAPTGGSNYEKCNNQDNLPCSEYQCRSLGQSCQLINPGTEEEKCAWLNRKDVKPPVITEWEVALLTDFNYAPVTFTSPGDRGARIVYDKSVDGCIPAYTPLSFGISADEPARCKLDYQRKATFAEMQFDFGGSNLYRYNHSQVLSLPGANVAEEESPVLENDGEFELFIRCMDANGNGDPANRASSDASGRATPFTEGVENTASFVFQFCVDKGPDTTPPKIITTDIINGMPIAYGTTSTGVKLYINEPSLCKWSRSDQAYEKMEEQMSCKSNVIEMNARRLYECETTLTGLKDGQENKFYFRCEDQQNMPENDRARNQESYEFSLMGTRELVLNEAGPSGLIRDSTDVVQVKLTAKTSAGYEEGKSTCEYSDTDEPDSYIPFYTTYKADGEHEQELYLPAGDYFYYIKCIDLGGNQDQTTISFTVESDRIAPLITRAYHEENFLKLITSEDAECVYGNADCNYLFDDGIKMTVVDGRAHFTDWDTKANFYIKCKDEWGNQPIPDECSMVARASENFDN